MNTTLIDAILRDLDTNPKRPATRTGFGNATKIGEVGLRIIEDALAKK